jgi:chromosome segregation ATPase
LQARDDRDNETHRDLQEKVEYATRMIKALEQERDRLHNQEKALYEQLNDTEMKVAASEESQATLLSTIAQLEQEKNHLTSELNALRSDAEMLHGKNGVNIYRGFESRMKRLEGLLADRESTVAEKEEQLFSRERELEIREQQEAARVEERNVRIRNLAEQLRQKEMALTSKEAEITSNVNTCEARESRVERLALELQSKASKLASEQAVIAQRLSECDLLEQQLESWQQQLEEAKADSNGGQMLS